MRSISASTCLRITIPIYPIICLLIDDLCTLLVCLRVTCLCCFDVTRTEVKTISVYWKNAYFVTIAEPFEIGVSSTESIYQAFAAF